MDEPGGAVRATALASTGRAASEEVQLGGDLATGTSRVRVHLLGPFAVEQRGAALPDRSVGSRKGRTLLKLLVADRGHVVPTDRIVEALWPQDQPERPERDVATLVSRLRALLGSDAIVGGPDGYRFVASESVEVDLDEADRLTSSAEAREASAEPALARAAVERAVEILARGRPLEDEPYAPWADEVRAFADGLVRRARGVLWRTATDLGDVEVAVAAARAAIADDPFDEGAHRALMVALDRGGSPGEALLAYERLRTVLADELGTDPAPETVELHLTILRGEAAVSEGATGPPVPVRTDPTDPGFVGRSDELSALADHWARAAAGHTSFVAIVGEAGIGKTRLAREAVTLAAATGGTVLESRCYEAERSLFLEPVAEAIRSVVVRSNPDAIRRAAGEWAGPLADLVPEVGTILRPPAYERASPEIERRRAFEAVTGFLRTTADAHPTLLLLDDLQNAGSSTLELLHFLARRAPRSRLLVICIVRTEDSDEVLGRLAEPTLRIDLGPLADEAVALLAERMGAADLAGRISAMTRGHPLFVVETLRALSEGHAPPTAMTIPASLQSAVLARIGRTGPGVDELLGVAATLGSSFDLQLAASLLEAPLEDAARRAERARRARLLVEAGPSFEFANDLIREIVYRTTPLPIRRARHRRAAALLEDPEAVASHSAAAEDWPAAVEGWLRAADRAVARYSNRDAAEILSRAIDAATRGQDPLRLAEAHLRRGRAREALAEFEGSVADHGEAVRLARDAGDRRLEMLALRELGGDALIGLGRPAKDCVPYLEEGLAIAEELDDGPVRVDLLSRMAVVWSNMLRFDLAKAASNEALMIARALGDDRSVAVALDGVKTAAAYAGDLSRLELVLPELLPLLRRQGNLMFLQWAVFEGSFVPMARGRWDEALATVEEAIGVGRRSGWLAFQPMFAAHLGWIERSRGRYGQALDVGARAVEVAEELGHTWWVAFAEAMLGWTLSELFQHERAIEHLQRGLGAVESNATAGYLVRCVAHLALAAASLGDLERARFALDRADEVFATIGAPPGAAFLHGAHSHVAAAEAWRILGEPERAQRLAGPILEAAEAFGWLEVSATAALAIGRSRLLRGDTPGGRALLERALRVARPAPLPSVTWQAHAELARVAAGEGRVEQSERHTASARAVVGSLAASIPDPALREAFLDGAKAAIDRAALPA